MYFELKHKYFNPTQKMPDSLLTDFLYFDNIMFFCNEFSQGYELQSFYIL